MPFENTSKTGVKAKRSPRLSSLAEDILPTDDAPFRARLHQLFSQIEKEFEGLYLENLSCECPWDHWFIDEREIDCLALQCRRNWMQWGPGVGMSWELNGVQRVS